MEDQTFQSFIGDRRLLIAISFFPVFWFGRRLSSVLLGRGLEDIDNILKLIDRVPISSRYQIALSMLAITGYYFTILGFIFASCFTPLLISLVLFRIGKIYGDAILFVIMSVELGLFAFYLRARMQIVYGLIEIAIGSIIAFQSTYLSPRSSLFAISGGVYVIVRGLDNVEKSLERNEKKWKMKNRMHKAWAWFFYSWKN